MSHELRLYKGYQSGLEQSILYELDENGTKVPFDLTNASVYLEIYDLNNNTRTVLATITGTVDDDVNGVFTVRPALHDLDDITSGRHYYAIKVVNSEFTNKGRLYDSDDHNKLLPCYIV